jgi:hypothetical protein
MKHYVYLIEKRNALPAAQKYYIGVRSCKGLIGDDKYMSSSKTLQKDIKLNGRNNYNKIILKRFDTREDAFQYEIKLHDEFDVANNPIFFNKAKQLEFGFGGPIGEKNAFYGKHHTNEWKSVKSNQMKGNTNAKGYKHTDKTLEKIKLVRSQQVFTEQTFKKRSESNKGNQYAKGHIHTDEWKRKASIRKIGNKHGLGRVVTEEEKKMKSTQNVGLVWMNDGQRNHRIKPEFIGTKMTEGLTMGYLRKNKGE